jgi:hypothetical protein
MSNKSNLTLHQGENWSITFAAHYADNTVMPLGSSDEVEFRIADASGRALLTKSVGDGVTIVDEPQGLAEILITTADQDAAGIGTASVYVYEVRVTKGGERYIQAEGLVLVAHSLFAETIDPLLIEFRARLPEFTEDDTLISLYLLDAGREIAANENWPEAEVPLATIMLAAHFLQMRKTAATNYAAGALGGGQVRAIRTEDRMISFDTSSSQSTATSRSGLASTGYGERYLAMLRRQVRWLKRA